MSSTARLTWLHLSDFHLRTKSGWSQDVVLKSMLDDIQDRYVGASRPDLLFLTGDIAFSGKKEEYDLAEDFVRKLCAGLKIELERLCVIPGNHDIDLDREEDAFIGARCTLQSTTEVDRFFGNEGRCKTIFARQAAFRDFVNNVAPLNLEPFSSISYAHCRIIQVGTLRIKVLLLDSAWLAQGGVEDVGALLVGEKQVLDCCCKDGFSEDGFLTFALLHHPVAWLKEFEQVSIENLLMRNAQICLQGHVHSPGMRSVEAHQGRLTTFTAGAAFQTRTSDNSYMWCSLDLASGEGEKVVHRYDHAGHRWDAGERETWHLVSRPPPIGDVGKTLKSMERLGIGYSAYVACLLADLQTEVPLRMPNGTISFLNFDARIPGIPSEIGEVIKHLRYHFYWQHVWEASSWEIELQQLATLLDSTLRAIAMTDAAELLNRETHSRAILDELIHRGESSVALVCTEIRCLLSDGEILKARQVLVRWLGQDFLRPNEILDLRRLEIVILLAEGNGPDALFRGDTLLEEAQRIPADIALVARCAFDASEYERAASLMHAALDAFVPIEEIRTLALRIAGAAGDKRLTERVKP